MWALGHYHRTPPNQANVKQSRTILQCFFFFWKIWDISKHDILETPSIHMVTRWFFCDTTIFFFYLVYLLLSRCCISQYMWIMNFRILVLIQWWWMNVVIGRWWWLLSDCTRLLPICRFVQYLQLLFKVPFVFIVMEMLDKLYMRWFILCNL